MSDEVDRLTRIWSGTATFKRKKKNPKNALASMLPIEPLPCVIGWREETLIKMHVVPEEVPCFFSKGWSKEHGTVIDTQAGDLRLTQQQRTAPMPKGESGHKGFGVGPGRNPEVGSTNHTSFASHTFKCSRDVLERMVPRCGLFLSRDR